MKVEHTLHIDAPPAKVWAVTEDVERWPEWTPTMDAVRRLDDGPFDVGGSATIRQPGLPETVWTVTHMVRGQSFAWTARVRGIRMRATHEVHADVDGTRSVLRVEAFGLAAALLWLLLRGQLRNALRQENEGLKTRCEET